MTRIASIPAMVNAHSHAFQRGLRGRVERLPAGGTDDFWTWRTQMFELAGRLEPETMHVLAAQAFDEMAAAGYGAVGEFHYVHHRPDGAPYGEPNAMAHAVAQAAVQAGLEIVLLPAAYHRNGWDGGDRPPEPGQLRFCDANVETFLARVDALLEWAAPRQGISVGIAAHSVRAVPAAWLEAIARYADAHGLVRHIHAHEQRRELDECAAEHGCSPIELLDATGFLDSRASVIHGIHVTDADVSLLARSGATVVSCPTTEGNLGDGYLPAMAYAQAGVPLAVGSDSQVRIDPFEEARELETLSRRERQLRSGLLAASGGQLWEELCAAGRASLGLSDRGTDAEAGAQPRAVRGASGAQRGARGAQRGARGAQPGAPSAQRGAQLRCEVDLDHPDLRGINPADLHLALVTCASAGVVVGGAGRAARSPGGPSGV